MTISETVLILAGGTAVLAIPFGIRLAMRAVAGGGAADPSDGSGARRGRRHRAAAFGLSRPLGGGSGARGGRLFPAIWPTLFKAERLLYPSYPTRHEERIYMDRSPAV
jgi:hypothetical protein